MEPKLTKKLIKLGYEERLRGIRVVDKSDDKFRKQVNSSGFPLQIGIKRAVEKTWENHGWKVITEEHPWENQISGESGFIDIILEHVFKTQLLVECKRVRECEWIFLVPSNIQNKSQRAKSWTTLDEKWSNWLDWELEPKSYESNFCVVPGQNAKDKPMLEREASKIIEATEAFAIEEKLLRIPDPNDLRAYFSVIVTTADLKICRFDHDKIDIKSGEITECDFEDVPFIRFRKALTARNEDPPQNDIYKMFQEKERTVLVINSNHFVDFLKKWKRGDWPQELW